MTPRSLLLQSARLLSDAGVPDPENDAALLLAHLTGLKPLFLRVDMDSVISPEVYQSYQILLNRRINREPLQYILGTVPFHELDFKVDSRVLIPRPETSLLVDWALERLSSVSNPSVLDLCCGSGCIGLSIRSFRPDASVTLTDLSRDAADVARENSERLNLPVEILEGDLFSPVQGRTFDLILSNPPYIPSSACLSLQQEVLSEPRMALDGGEDGLSFYRRIASQAPVFLRKGGQIMLELGIDEAEAVRNLLLENDACTVEFRKDFSGVNRMITAVYSSPRRIYAAET